MTFQVHPCKLRETLPHFAERYVDYDDEIFDILTEIKRNGDCMTWFPANIAYLVFTLPFDLVYNTIE